MKKFWMTYIENEISIDEIEVKEDKRIKRGDKVALIPIIAEGQKMSTEEKILKTCQTVAVVGLSPKLNRPSNMVASYLKENGYKIIPVNPRAGEILGEICYTNLSSIPGPVDVVNVFRRPKEVAAIVEEAIKIGAKAVWMQEGVINHEAATQAMEAGLLVVMNKCMLKEHWRLQKQER